MSEMRHEHWRTIIDEVLVATSDDLKDYMEKRIDSEEILRRVEHHILDMFDLTEKVSE